MNQYSSAKICPYQKSSCTDEEKLALEPGSYCKMNVKFLCSKIHTISGIHLLDIELILATSTDYDELNYVWSEWRKIASRPMIHDYEQYVELNNKVAEVNGILTLKSFIND